MRFIRLEIDKSKNYWTPEYLDKERYARSQNNIKDKIFLNLNPGTTGLGIYEKLFKNN